MSSKITISEQARLALKRQIAAKFANSCHAPDSGRFCDGPGTERSFGDYEMLYVSPSMGNGSHQIITMLGDEEVAKMSWGPKEIHGLDVNDEHQRKGIAKAMWEWGQEFRTKPKHSADRTTKGDAWAKAIGGKLPKLKPAPDFAVITAAAVLKAAGLVVIAGDTSRVLMLQRALSDKDPASGKWEFPGGTINPGEDPGAAALREWKEETGSDLPDGKFTGTWTSPNGVYKGFVYQISKESDLTLNLDHEDRRILNPDDPDGDEIEVIAWWAIDDLIGMPALRDEVQDTDWDILRNAITAAGNPCHAPDTGRFCETEGGRWENALKTASKTPEGSKGGKYWLSPNGKFVPVKEFHGEVSGPNIKEFAKRAKAIRVSGLSDTDVNIEMWGKATDEQIKAIADHLTRSYTYAEAHSENKDTYEALTDPTPSEVEALLGRLNGFLGGKATNPSRLREYLSADVKVIDLDSAQLTAGAKSLGPCCRPQGGGTGCGRPDCMALRGPAFPTQDTQRPMAPKPPKNYFQESEEWVAKLTPEEQKAASDYTGSYLYSEINKAAVNGTPDSRVEALDSALAKAGKRDTPIRAYRRASFEGKGAAERRDAYVASLSIGDEISLAQPNSFQSASVTPRYPVITGWPPYSVMYEINARSGASVGNVTQGGGTVKELEILFPRPTRFKVVAIQHDVQFGPPPKTRELGDTRKRLVIQVEEV